MTYILTRSQIKDIVERSNIDAFDRKSLLETIDDLEERADCDEPDDCDCEDLEDEIDGLFMSIMTSFIISAVIRPSSFRIAAASVRLCSNSSIWARAVGLQSFATSPIAFRSSFLYLISSLTICLSVNCWTLWNSSISTLRRS